MTKWVITAALDSFESDRIANILIFSLMLIFGCPQKFITDNGTNFISEAMKVVCQRLGIRKVETSVEHPQSDGLVERMNRTIKTGLGLYCEKNPTDWDIYLPFVTFAINTSKQKSTGYSPFQIMFGRKAVLPKLNEISSLVTTSYTTEAWINYLNQYIPVLHAEIHQNIQKNQEQQQRYYNRSRKEKELFAVGDRVLKIKMKDSWKFSEPKFTGPWKIVKSLSKEENNAFVLELEQDQRKRNYKDKKTTTANVRDIYKIY